MKFIANNETFYAGLKTDAGGGRYSMTFIPMAL
jgi:hypothetical protein